MKRLLALLLALAMLLSAAAFAEEAAETPEEAAPAEETAAEETEEEAPAVLLATINGEEIYEDNDSLQYYLTEYLSEMEEEEHCQELAQMYAMDMALKIRLINQRALENITDEQKASLSEQAAADWEGILKNYAEQYFGITSESSEEDQAAARADVLAILESMGWTEERYLSEELNALVYNNYLNSISLELENDPAYSASEEEIQQYYNEQVEEDQQLIGNNPMLYELYPQFMGKDSYYIPAGFRGITHILLTVEQSLLDTWSDLTARLEEANEASEAESEEAGDSEDAEDGEEAGEAEEEAEEALAGETAAPEETAVPEEPVTQEMVDQAAQAILDSLKEKLDEIQAKLDAGTSFEDLIAEYGQDPGMQDPELLQKGYPVHADSMIYDAIFTAAASRLEKVGDISDPFVTQFGVHILKYQRDIPEGAIEMTAEVHDELKATIESEKQSEAFMSMLDEWMKSADIVYTAEGESWKYDEALVNEYLSAGVEEEEDEEGEDTDTEAPAEDAEAPAEETEVPAA